MSILPVRDGEFSETAVQSALRRGVLSVEGFIPFPREATEQSIPDRFEQQVARYPTRIALKTVKNALTYEALNRAANRIARTIVALRGTANEPIAFLLKEDAQLIAGILGALKAGKIYVALDPSYPRRNISFMLDDSQAALLLTDEAHARLASSIAGRDCTVVNLEENRPRSFEENLGVGLSPDKLTSSTHRALPAGPKAS
jgi:non-ribosomal peptide synthetase component F